MTTKTARKGTLCECISVGCFLKKCTIVRKNNLQDNAFLQNLGKNKMDASLSMKGRIHSGGLLTLVTQTDHTGDHAADAQGGSQ